MALDFCHRHWWGLLAISFLVLTLPAGGVRLQATIGQVTGGSCGYTDFPPESFLVTGFSEALYRNGAMCGSCFKVQCINDKNCITERAVTVMVTSICQSTNGSDICKAGNMALNLDPRAWDLIVSTRAVGQVPIVMYAVSCPQMTGGIVLNVTDAAEYYMQVLIQNVGGTGRLQAVYASPDGKDFYALFRNYGSVWANNDVNFLGGPVTLKLVDMRKRILTLTNALPADWSTGAYMTNKNWRY